MFIVTKVAYLIKENEKKISEKCYVMEWYFLSRIISEEISNFY
jgi:hypothetical protein